MTTGPKIEPDWIPPAPPPPPRGRGGSGGIVAFLNLQGELASPSDRVRSNAVYSSHTEPGQVSTLSVLVKNIDAVPCESCTVRFFVQKSAFEVREIFRRDGLRLPETTLKANETAEFSIQWTVTNDDVGAATIYAQIQTPIYDAYASPDNMALERNARKEVRIALPMNTQSSIQSASP